METYSVLRAFADSWFLIAMMAFYLMACLLPFVRSQRSAVIEASTIPFRNDDTPMGQANAAPKLKTCSGTCASCKCIPQSLEVQ